MNKKLRALLGEVNAKKQEVEALASEGRIEEAKAAKEELVALQQKFDLLQDVVDAPGPPAWEAQNAAPAAMPGTHPAGGADPVHLFAEAARRGFRNDGGTSTPDYASEGVDADGGYTVPQDIQTRINRYKEDRFSLETLVTRVPVSAPSGRRVFMTRAQHTGFSQVDEGAAIGATSTPKFTPLSYQVKKYAGYLPVTNELLKDSDANIAAALVEWLGEEDIATKNAAILAALATLTAVDLKDLDGIKKAVNVTLGQRFAGSVRVVTNDDGLNWLDTLKDENKQYLLKPSLDPARPMEKRLAVGAATVPVTVVPNAVLPSTTSGTTTVTTTIPFYVGDLKEAVLLFDRERLTILQSNIASVGDFNAFEQDMTLFRGTMRLDCKVKDAAAVVRGTVTA